MVTTHLNAKRVGPVMPVCDGGRHIPSHVDMTCDEADEWIAFRDRILHDLLASAMQADPDSGTPMRDVPPALRGPNWRPAG